MQESRYLCSWFIPDKPYRLTRKHSTLMLQILSTSCFPQLFCDKSINWISDIRPNDRNFLCCVQVAVISHGFLHGLYNMQLTVSTWKGIQSNLEQTTITLYYDMHRITQVLFIHSTVTAHKYTQIWIDKQTPYQGDSGKFPCYSKPDLINIKLMRNIWAFILNKSYRWSEYRIRN